MINPSPIIIKGIRDGLLISVESGGRLSAGDIDKAIRAELDRQKGFLRGSRVAFDVGDAFMSKTEITQLMQLLEAAEITLWTLLTQNETTKDGARELGLATRLPGSMTDLAGNQLATANTENEGVRDAKGLDALFLKETLRSGRSVVYDGSVIILGDVNPGAEVIAGGDVIVWGRLRGLVHAGFHGSETAVICALELIPTQLRIGEHIAIAPDERRAQPIPEVAHIRHGRIIADAWPVK